MIKNSIIREFSASYSPAESKSKLWMLLKGSIVGNFYELSSSERCELLAYYELLGELLEQVYIECAPFHEDVEQ